MNCPACLTGSLSFETENTALCSNSKCPAHERCDCGSAWAGFERDERPPEGKTTWVAVCSNGDRRVYRVSHELTMADRRTVPPLTAALLRDYLFADSLRRLYLEPLKEVRGGEDLIATLRAYYEAGGNVSQAGAILDINRRTVSSRLAMVEEVLHCSVVEHSAEIQAALMLEQLDG